MMVKPAKNMYQDNWSKYILLKVISGNVILLILFSKKWLRYKFIAKASDRISAKEADIGERAHRTCY